MARPLRVPKTLQQKLSDLDDHLFLLRQHLHRLNDGVAHLKVIAAELRVLVCLSSRTNEGLLWRLIDDLKVPDEIYLHVAGEVNPDHPLARALKFSIVPIQRGGKGHPQLPPDYHALKQIIKEYEAVFISGKGLTHESLIKAVAEQMGSAHEDEGLSYALDDLKQIFINGVEAYTPILATDAELVLEVGERVLEKVEAELGYQRKSRSTDYGDVSIVIRLGLRQMLAARLHILSFRSYISDIEIKCEAGPQSLVFRVLKHGKLIEEVRARYPNDWEINTDAVFALEYSSRLRKAHAMTNEESQDKGINCDIGWLHAQEISLEEVPKGFGEFIYRQFALNYPRLLSSEECLSILALPTDAHGIWKYEDELSHEGPFR